MLSKRTSIILLSAIFLGSNCFTMEPSNNLIPKDDLLTHVHLSAQLDQMHQQLQELQESTDRTQQLVAGMATQADFDKGWQLIREVLDQRAENLRRKREILEEYKIHWIIEAILRCFGIDDTHSKDE